MFCGPAMVFTAASSTRSPIVPVNFQASKSGVLENAPDFTSAEAIVPPSGSAPLVRGPAVRFSSERL